MSDSDNDWEGLDLSGITAHSPVELQAASAHRKESEAISKGQGEADDGVGRSQTPSHRHSGRRGKDRKDDRKSSKADRRESADRKRGGSSASSKVAEKSEKGGPSVHQVQQQLVQAKRAALNEFERLMGPHVTPAHMDAVSSSLTVFWNSISGHLGGRAIAAGKIPHPQQHVPPSKRKPQLLPSDPKAIKRKVRGLLNKVAQETRELIFGQLLEITISDSDVLDLIVEEVFEKAIDEPKFNSLYAELCVRWTKVAPTFGELRFDKLLMRKCQQEFDARVAPVDCPEMSKSDRYEADVLRRLRTSGNMRFIGELYKFSMMSQEIVLEAIDQLSSPAVQHSEDDLEALCSFLQSVGKRIDTPELRKWLDSTFRNLAGLAKSPQYCNRIRFLLDDILDLREHNWKPRADRRATFSHFSASPSHPPRILHRAPNRSKFGSDPHTSIPPAPVPGPKLPPSRREKLSLLEMPVLEKMILGCFASSSLSVADVVLFLADSSSNVCFEQCLVDAVVRMEHQRESERFRVTQVMVEAKVQGVANPTNLCEWMIDFLSTPDLPSLFPGVVGRLMRRLVLSSFFDLPFLCRCLMKVESRSVVEGVLGELVSVSGSGGDKMRDLVTSCDLPLLFEDEDMFSQFLEREGLLSLFPFIEYGLVVGRSFVAGDDPHVLLSLIAERFPPPLEKALASSASFVRLVFHHLIVFLVDHPGQADMVISKFLPLLRFVLQDSNLHLQCLFQIQYSFWKAKYSESLIADVFSILRDRSLISPDAFLEWKDDISDSTPGKGQCLFKLNRFFGGFEIESTEDDGEDDVDEIDLDEGLPQRQL